MILSNFLKALSYKPTLIIYFLIFNLQAENIYVSKTGNDNNSGTEAQPFKSIAKASQEAKPGDVIIIGGGTYEELLQPARSGTPGNPITYKGKEGEKVIITAMQAINNWVLDENSVYKAQVNWDLGQDNMVLHNDKLLDLARWPNNTPQNIFERDYLPGATGGGRTWLDYAPGIPNWDWENGGSIHFYGGAGFLAWTDYIKTSTTNRVTFDLIRQQNWIALRHHPGYTGHGVKKGEFFLQGIRSALDYKNEWFYNKSTKTLFVQVEGGGKPVNNTIRFRKRTQTIKLNKDFIHIENLAVFGGSIDITGNNNKIFEVSSFYGNHTLGVISGFDSGRQSVLITGKNNLVQKCEIAWGAGNGVYDKGEDNTVLNSYIHDFDYLGNYDCVLNTRGAKKGKYLKNTLTRSGKDIIQAYVDGGEFAYNDVSLNNFVADDGGLLYTTNARAQKSTIHHNTFHDSKARQGRFKATGIYLDNDSKNWDVHHNLVWNTQWTGIQINWNGTNLNIFNNTFCKNSATMGAWHKAGTSFSNVKVWNNITDKETIDQQGNQEEEVTWEPQSDKQNNLVSKESFVNWDSNNFKLKANSQAVDYGRVINGITNGYIGAKPDVGALEYSQSFQTGIDWDPKDGGPTGTGCYNLPGEDCDFCNAPLVWYEDSDGDGLGDPNSMLLACEMPSGCVNNTNDLCVDDELNTCTILHEIQGLIQVENYTLQQGIQREATSDVGGGKNIGYIEDGDFTEYKSLVNDSGSYVVNLRYASLTQGGSVKILSNGSQVGEFNLSSTGGWQNWETASTTLFLDTGNANIRLVYSGVDGFLFNINWIEFAKTLSVKDVNKIDNKLTIFPNPAKNSLIIKDIDENREFSIHDITGKLIVTIAAFNTPRITVDLEKFSEGIYLIIDSKSKAVYKFIKQ